MRTHLIASLVAISVVALHARGASVRPSGAPRDFERAEVAAVAQQLCEQLGTPLEKTQQVMERLRNALKNEDWNGKYASRGISAVFAFQMGEGGLIVKVKKGKGLLRWKGHTTATPLRFKAVTYGAQIGGSSEWGIGLVFGLRRAGAFGGDYSGNTRGATAGGASMNVTELHRTQIVAEEMSHAVYLIGAASGLSANAGGANLTIFVDE